MKPKALLFYTYLPPWRIDVFNEMDKYYDLTIVFLYADATGFTYNRSYLSNKLKAKHIFWNLGLDIGKKPFRVGFLHLILKYKPEIVFTHEFSQASIFISILLKLRIFNFQHVITTSNNIIILNNIKKTKLFIQKFVLKSSTGLIVYSDSVKEWYNNNFPEVKVEICPNIQNPKTLLSNREHLSDTIRVLIDTYKLRNSKVILYIGRIEKVKALDLLIEAFQRTKNGDYKLVIVGEGSEAANLKKLINKLNLVNRVLLTGYMEGVRLYAWYTIANFFVLPSIYEPFGAVVNEALVFGCPVLASKYIGALDYIDENKNGRIFDPLDSENFITVLNKAMQLYSSFNSEKKDLMIYSFEESVKSFQTILY
ncbi:MAG: glycosyltransferase [Salinivirgaceae bacterium]|jgi:glycosyltransferase involved in cell wall biosynthesis|nr:glycosyltransferase [Salinivirgaceae bacterium]